MGGEGTQPIRSHSIDTGHPECTYADSEPPLGVTTCLSWGDGSLVAGNTFSHSQLRVWDTRSAALVDRFNFPSFTNGVRCLQLQPRRAYDEAQVNLVGETLKSLLLLLDLLSIRR